MSDDEANKRAWQDVEIQRLPYSRGAMYLLDANAKIIAVSKGVRSIDNVVLELLRRKENGLKYGLKEWLDMMIKEIGPRAKEDWEAMSNGSLIIPALDALGPNFRLVRRDQEPWELGFPSSSLSSRVIDGIIPDSRAAEVGLRDGDLIVRNDYIGNSADHYERNMTLVIRRDGKEANISYWPRKRDKVECWQWIRDSEEYTGLEL